jgi:protein ImuB
MLLPIPEPITVVAALPEGPPELMRWRRTLSRIVRAEGPERIAPEWWREIGAAASRTRDYYVAEDETGARFWLFRDGRHASEEDADRPPVWYLHGVFG